MRARANYREPVQRRTGVWLIAQAACALGLMAPVEPLHAGSVSAQLKARVRVVTSCAIGLNTDGGGDFATQPPQGSPHQRVLLTSHCTQHPGSADSMRISTESRHGSDAKIEVISRADAGRETFATGASDQSGTPDRNITRWGIVPMNSRLLVSTGSPTGAADAPQHERSVTLLIDY